MDATRPYLFISYSRHDRAFVDRLVGDLARAGIEVWRDTDMIQAGANWQSSIAAGLQGAAALLFVLSSASLHSAYMLRELQLFARREGRVFPIRIEGVHPDRLPSELRALQWADFSEDYARGFEALLAALQRLFDLTTAPRRPAASQPIRPAHKARRSNPAKGYVFLSYAEEDRAFVVRLRQFLKRRHYGYWDYEESDRDYHSQLFLELEGVIREAVATVCVLSPDWRRSKWTIREFLYSEDIETPVFLVRAKPMDPTLVTAGLTYIDFVEDPVRARERLDRELARKGL